MVPNCMKVEGKKKKTNYPIGELETCTESTWEN